MFESIGRGWKMIAASIRMGWQEKRLLLPSFLTVLGNFIFISLLFCQGMLFMHGQPGTSQHIAANSHHLLQHLQPNQLTQIGGLNGIFDQSGWGTEDMDWASGSQAGWLALLIITLWWLTNRFLEGVTTALVYSHLTEGPGSGKFSIACQAVFASLPAIIWLGLATFIARTIARSLRGKQAAGAAVFGFSLSFLASLVQVFWTLASHLILPAIVIEGTSFWGALKRADKMASGNLLTIGFGEVGVDAICTGIFWLVASCGIAGFYYAQTQGILLSPLCLTAACAWIVLVILITAMSIYIRAAFYTCLYVWAIEAEAVTEMERHHIRPPAPLAQALA